MSIYLKHFLFVPTNGTTRKKLPQIDFNLWILFKREMIKKNIFAMNLSLPAFQIVFLLVGFYVVTKLTVVLIQKKEELVVREPKLIMTNVMEGLLSPSYLMLGPLGFFGGCQETARNDSLTATTDNGSRPSGLVGNVVAGVGRLSVQPPICPPPFEQASTVIL